MACSKLFADPTDEWSTQMYAIAFDLNINNLKRVLGKSYTSIYAKIKKCLEESGFERKQRSLYYPRPNTAVTPRHCQAAVSYLHSIHGFSQSVRDIRMLKIIEGEDNLMPF